MVLSLLCLMFFMSSPSVEPVSAADGLAPGMSISLNQTIVSTGGMFALGFFFAGKSSQKIYAGIWYNNIPNKTIVWVANRERPLLDPSGVLTIARDGNIAVLEAAGGILWSSNVSGISSNTSAVLQDNGNLVLRGQRGNVWQSFDYPTDTLVPGMKLVSTFRSHVFNRLTAWRDADDPSPGKFSIGFDPALFLQIIVLRGSEIYMRSQVWNGLLLDGTRVASSTPSMAVATYEAGGEWLNLTFSSTEGSPAVRHKLDSTGSFKGMFWNDTAKDWVVAVSVPGRPCEVYNSCGPFAVCNISSPSLACSCLQGYEPKNQVEWDKGSYSQGCARGAQFNCGAGDSFQRRSGIKLPDKFTLMRNVSSLEQCQGECLRRCNCVAYAYASTVGNWGNGSWCLLWLGDMLDITQLEVNGQDLYIRVAASQQVTDSRSDKRSSNRSVLVLVMLPTLVFVIFLMGICYFIKRSFKRRERHILPGGMNISDEVRNGKDTIDLQFLDFGSVIVATDNFSDVNKLGEGGFGPVYKVTSHHLSNYRYDVISDACFRGSKYITLCLVRVFTTSININFDIDTDIILF